jgi:hypothetical protein
MPNASVLRRRWLLQLAAATAATLAAGAVRAQVPRPAAPPPVRPGMARLWFYRAFLPDDTEGMPQVFVNGAPAGYAEGGTSFYRDVPAGPCQISVDSYRPGLFQPDNFVVAPGQQLYVEIVSLPHFEEGGGRGGGYRRGTYYPSLVSPQTAAIMLPQMRFQGGG